MLSACLIAIDAISRKTSCTPFMLLPLPILIKHAVQLTTSESFSASAAARIADDLHQPCSRNGASVARSRQHIRIWPEVGRHISSSRHTAGSFEIEYILRLFAPFS